MDTIKSVFEEVSKDIVVDSKMIQRIHDYERAFVNRNEDHIAFFGGNLMGVHPMRFRPVDRDTWFSDVLGIDDLLLEDGVKELKSIDPSWRRANDVMNLSCVWLLHAIHEQHDIPPALKEQGMINTLLVMQYKFLGSLMAHFYPYPADQATMLAAYASLSHKYALKVAGSWSNLLTIRAKELLSARSIHRRTYQTFTEDKAIIYMVNDIQGRLREIVKSMTKNFYEIRARGDKITSEKSVMDIDGEIVLRDKTKPHAMYIRYIQEVLGDRNSFVREDLVNVIADAMHTMPPKLLTEALEWMSVNHRAQDGEIIDKLATESLLYAFDLMSRNRELMGSKTGLMPLLVKLRSLYMASRMSDPALLLTKELSEHVVSKAVKTKNPSVIASVRTGLQLYIVLRSLAMSYYQN